MGRCFGIIGSLKKGGLKRCEKQAGKSIFCSNHRLQPIGALCTLILFVGSIASIYAIFSKPPIYKDKAEKYDVKIKPFKEETFGILVAGFQGNTEEFRNKGKEIQGTINSTLNARFIELNIHDAEARELSTSIFPFLKAHEDARKLGKKYNAEIIIWGDVTLVGVIPKITIVNPQSPITIVSQPDINLLKNTLLHTAIDDIDDIRFPALTDEPTLLVSFLTGVKYYYKSNYDKALYYFKKSLPENHIKYIDSTPILVFIGNTYNKKQEYDNAISVYNEAIKINPNYALAYSNRGNSYREKGDINKALIEYDKAIKIKPQSQYAAYNNRGCIYAEQGKVDIALDDFNEAIKINPKFAGAYNNRGNAYKDKGDNNKAFTDYNIAIEIAPKLFATYYNRGLLHKEKNNFDKAILDFTKVVEINPRFGEAYNNRGILYAKMGKFDEALSDFNQIIKINPKNAEAYSNRANVYTLMGKLDKSFTDVERALDINPEFDKAYNNRGSLYEKKEEYDEAISDYNQAIKINPKNAKAYNNRGNSYAKKGEYEKAISDYNQAININPKYAQAYYNKALVLKMLGLKNKSVEAYNKSIQYASPRDTQIDRKFLTRQRSKSSLILHYSEDWSRIGR